MSVSAAEKASIAARVAARMIGRNRYMGAAGRALQAATGSWARILGILWLEVTGFVFLSLAVFGGFAFAREYAKYHAGEAGLGRVVLAICFTLTFAWFGVSSFWRARKASAAQRSARKSQNADEAS
jgi:hypothetical protein